MLLEILCSVSQTTARIRERPSAVPVDFGYCATSLGLLESKPFSIFETLGAHHSPQARVVLQQEFVRQFSLPHGQTIQKSLRQLAGSKDRARTCGSSRQGTLWRQTVSITRDDDITGIYELLDAIEAVIKAADPAKREGLARTIDAYAEDFPDDFFWATGSQAPTLLNHMLNTIDSACRPEAQSKPRPAIRLVDRKPEGNA
jgi:hypothetical protein